MHSHEHNNHDEEKDNNHHNILEGKRENGNGKHYDLKGEEEIVCVLC